MQTFMEKGTRSTSTSSSESSRNTQEDADGSKSVSTSTRMAVATNFGSATEEELPSTLSVRSEQEFYVPINSKIMVQTIITEIERSEKLGLTPRQTAERLAQKLSLEYEDAKNIVLLYITGMVITSKFKKDE